MSGLNLGVSVIICCHNSAKRLPETLRHLAAQQVSEGIPWEVIVVDNASTDNTATVAEDLWPQPEPAPLKVISEPRAGKNHALRRGFLAAQHEVISVIDDDNWIAGDWISRVSTLFTSHPEVGIYGGLSVAVGEIPLPIWFQNVQGYYATGPQHAKIGDVTDSTGALFWGAGMNVRKAAYQELIAHGFDYLVEDRKGGELTTGSDTELCYAIRSSGWRLWYDDGLVLRHFLPKERLRWDYAKRLLLGMGKAAPLFDLYLLALRHPPFAHSPPWKRTWLFQFLKVLRRAIALFIAHPGKCLTQPEGSLSALKWISHQGQLSMLWKLTGRYRALMSSLAHAPWARKFRSETR